MIVELTRFLSRGCKSLARTVCAVAPPHYCLQPSAPSQRSPALAGRRACEKILPHVSPKKALANSNRYASHTEEEKQSEQTARVTKKLYKYRVTQATCYARTKPQNTTSHKTSGIRSKTTLIKTNKNTYFITIKTGHWSHSQNTSNNFFPFSGRAILTYRQQDASLKRANNFFVNQQETRKKLLHNTFTKIGTNHTPTRPLVPSSPQPLVT